MNKMFARFSVVASLSSLISTLAGIMAGVYTSKAVGAATTDITATPTVPTVDAPVVNNVPNVNTNVKQ